MTRQSDESFVFGFTTKAVADEVDEHVPLRCFGTLGLSCFVCLLAFGLNLEGQQQLLQMNFKYVDFVLSGFH